MLNRANKNSCYFDKCLFKACFVSIAALVMTGKLSRNCIITNIKHKSKNSTAQFSNGAGHVCHGSCSLYEGRSTFVSNHGLRKTRCCCSSSAVSPGGCSALSTQFVGPGEVTKTFRMSGDWEETVQEC